MSVNAVRHALTRLHLLAGFLCLADGVWAQPLAVVTEQGAHAVAMVDLSALSVRRQVAVGEAPAGVAVDVQRRRAYVSNAEGRSVSMIDVDHDSVLLTRTLGALSLIHI